MISAVILVKNEEKHIAECIASVGFCDEIVVIDDNSDDNTAEIARSVGAIVYSRKLEKDFSAQRNFGLEKAKGDWVLFVDADERVAPELKNEITRAIKNTDIDGYVMQRVDFMWGKRLQYGETAHISLLRLAKKEKGLWKGTVHETWHITGNVQRLKSLLFHYPHQTINEFLAEINFYSDLRAQELFAHEVRVHWYDIILYPKMKFLQNYIMRRGFLDGTEGMVMALMMSFHSFLVRGKLWQLWDGKKSH